MFVHKLRIGPDEFEFTGIQLLHAVIGEIFDERIFPRHDPLEIEPDPSGVNAPWSGMAGQVHHLGGIKQRLGGHATAQDAQPANFVATFNNDDSQTRARCRSCRRITGAAATQNCHVKIKSVHVGKDGSTAGKCKFQILPWRAFRVEIRHSFLDDECMSDIIYPRSPRETMDGWMYLPRYIDKIRLHLAGKLHADYQENFGKGFDGMWLKYAGVTHEQMIDLVKKSITDGEVYDWVRRNVNKSTEEKAAYARDMLSRPKPGDEAALARLKMRKEQCNGLHRDDVKTFVDVIDLDEKRI